MAVYRAAQEALTNARKHAPGEPVTLRLGYGPDEVTLSVVNPIPPRPAETPLAGTGGRLRPGRPAPNAPPWRAAPWKSARTRGTGRSTLGFRHDRRTPKPVTVVVADDQAAVREGLVLLLGTLPGITVVGQAEDGVAAVETVAATQPQVVLMDLNMPRCDGVEATAPHPG